METTLLVTRIQRFSTQDGPGVRTTVFLQGCPLHCAWCHNPETQPFKTVLMWTPQNCIGCGTCLPYCTIHARRLDENGCPVYDRLDCIGCGECAAVCPTNACEVSAKRMTAREILRQIEKDRAFFGKNGGVTLSGGEPLYQADVIELMSQIKAAGLRLAVETSGAVSQNRIREAMPFVDLWLYDVKDTDEARLKQMTGGKLSAILDNLFLCDRLTAGQIRLRCIMVKGVNMNAAHYARINEIRSRLAHCAGVDLLPYHAYAGSKAEQVGMSDNGHKEWIPTEADMEEAKRYLQ